MFYSEEVKTTANRPNSASGSTAKKKVTFTGEGASINELHPSWGLWYRGGVCSPYFVLSHPSVEVDLEDLGQTTRPEGMTKELFINL